MLISETPKVLFTAAPFELVKSSTTRSSAALVQTPPRTRRSACRSRSGTPRTRSRSPPTAAAPTWRTCSVRMSGRSTPPPAPTSASTSRSAAHDRDHDRDRPQHRARDQGRSKQRPRKLRLKLDCGELACTATVRGEARVATGGRRSSVARRRTFALEPSTVAIAADATKKVRLRFKRNRSAKRISRLMKRDRTARRRSRLLVEVDASAPAGGTGSGKRRSRLKP